MFKVSCVLLISFTLQIQSSFANDDVIIIEEVVTEAPMIIEEHIEEYIEEDFSFENRDNAAIRAGLGITDIESTDKPYKAYKFQEVGVFVISNETFSNSLEAKNFCDSLSNVTANDNSPYELVNEDAAFSLTFTGLPFKELYEASVIDVPVILFEGKRGGVAFWTRDESGAVSNSHVLTFTDGNGLGASSVQEISGLSKRLVAAGKRPLAIQAICLDKKLTDAIDEE